MRRAIRIPPKGRSAAIIRKSAQKIFVPCAAHSLHRALGKLLVVHNEISEQVRDDAKAEAEGVVKQLIQQLLDREETRPCGEFLKPYLEGNKQLGPTDIGLMLNNQHVTAENWGDDLIAWLLNKLVRLDPTIPPTSLQTYIAYVLCAREGTATGNIRLAVGRPFKLQTAAVYRFLASTVFNDNAREQVDAMSELLSALMESRNSGSMLPDAGSLVTTNFLARGGGAITRRMAPRQQLHPLPENEVIEVDSGAEGDVEDDDAASEEGEVGMEVEDEGAAATGGDSEQTVSDREGVIDLVSSGGSEVEEEAAPEVDMGGEGPAPQQEAWQLAPGVEELAAQVLQDNWWDILYSFLCGYFSSVVQHAYEAHEVYQQEQGQLPHDGYDFAEHLE